MVFKISHILRGLYLSIFLLSLIDGCYCQIDPADIPYNDCGGSDRKQHAKVRVSGCDDDKICQITIGKLSTLQVAWRTDQPQIKNLKSSLVVTFPFGIRQEAKITPGDACSSVLKCPLRSHAQVMYIGNFTVPSPHFLLVGGGRIRWYGYETDPRKPLLCIDFQVDITA